MHNIFRLFTKTNIKRQIRIYYTVHSIPKNFFQILKYILGSFKNNVSKK